jgi:hypothetical protein
MANFQDASSFQVHDDYYTQRSTWEMITPFIPEGKTIWEMCLLNSNEQSKKYLAELLPTCQIIGNKNVNCLDENPYINIVDIIITNPPFETEIKKKILKKLVELKKPFIIILNALNIFSKYYHDIFKDTDIKYIIPSRKIHYDKYKEGGEELIESKKNTSFNSIFVTYGIVDKNIHL